MEEAKDQTEVKKGLNEVFEEAWEAINHEETTQLEVKLREVSAVILREACAPSLLSPSLPSLLSTLLSSPHSHSIRILLEAQELLSYIPQSPLFPSISSRLSDHLGLYYFANGEFGTSLVHFTRAISHLTASQPYEEKYTPFLHISETYAATGSYRNAVRFATQAATWALEALNTTFPRTPLYVQRKAVLTECYNRLVQYEEALGREGRVRHWARRAMAVMGVVEEGGKLRCPSPETRESQLTHSASIDTGDILPASRGSVRTLDYYWSFDSKDSSFGLSPHPHKLPDLDKKQEEVLPTNASESLAERDRLKTVSTENSERERKCRVSLKIRSRGQTLKQATYTLLHQVWRRLSSGLFAQVSIFSFVDSLLITVKGVGECQNPTEKVISECGQTDVKELASRVELDEKGEIVIRERENRKVDTRHPSIEFSHRRSILFHEKHTFNSHLYDIIYTLDDNKNIEIYAHTHGKTLRKTVINDLSFSSRTALVDYAKGTLAPKVTIEENKITLKGRERTEEWEKVMTKSTVFHSNYECKVTIFRPLESYIAWKVVAEGKERLVLEITDREVREITAETDSLKIASFLFSLLILENGSLLSLQKRFFRCGYSINVVNFPDESDNIQYRRLPVNLKLPNQVLFHDLETHAAVVIQRFIRRKQCMRSYRLRKSSRKRVVIGRFSVLKNRVLETVTISDWKNSDLQVVIEDESSKSRKSLRISRRKMDFSSYVAIKSTALQSISDSSSRAELITTRLQVIRGVPYIISVYRQRNSVEIRAVKAEKC